MARCVLVGGRPDVVLEQDGFHHPRSARSRKTAFTRYADLVRKRGIGSKGGKIKSITFANQATLRFMSAGGKDKSRAGYTSRVLAITEADGFEGASTSVEADKIKQLEARLASFDDRAIEFAGSFEMELARQSEETLAEVREVNPHFADFYPKSVAMP